MEKQFVPPAKWGYDSPFHIISAQLSEWGITFASKSVERKSNGIPAVRRLIRELDIHDCMVAADALNCQRETAEAIVQGKGGYLLAAKGESAGFRERNQGICPGREPEKNDGLRVRRREKPGSDGNADCIHYSRYKRLFGKEKAMESMHRLLDIYFSEGYCRVANRAVQQNLDMLRKFALRMIKQFKASSNSKRPLS